MVDTAFTSTGPSGTVTQTACSCYNRDPPQPFLVVGRAGTVTPAALVVRETGLGPSNLCRLLASVVTPAYTPVACVDSQACCCIPITRCRCATAATHLFSNEELEAT